MTEIWTSRFQSAEAIIRSGLAPVRITVGAPRWRLGYDLAGIIPEAAPDRSILHMSDEAEFRRRYLEKLAGHEQEILNQIDAIATTAGKAGVVLLCFEDLSSGTLWCHRRMLADALAAVTGQEIRELPLLDTTMRIA